jgi:hypothetical protein
VRYLQDRTQATGRSSLDPPVNVDHVISSRSFYTNYIDAAWTSVFGWARSAFLVAQDLMSGPASQPEPRGDSCQKLGRASVLTSVPLQLWPSSHMEHRMLRRGCARLSGFTFRLFVLKFFE